MYDLFKQYYWILLLPFPVLHAVRCEQRAYALAGAGLLSSTEAPRITRIVWLGALSLLAAMFLLQFSYSPRGVCAWFAEPLRPAALIAWVLIGTYMLRIVSLAVTPVGSAFLTRAWPAAMTSTPLSRVWRRPQVVRSALLNTVGIALFLGGMIWFAIESPGAFKC